MQIPRLAHKTPFIRNKVMQSNACKVTKEERNMKNEVTKERRNTNFELITFLAASTKRLEEDETCELKTLAVVWNAFAFTFAGIDLY